MVGSEEYWMWIWCTWTLEQHGGSGPNPLEIRNPHVTFISICPLVPQGMGFRTSIPLCKMA